MTVEEAGRNENPSTVPDPLSISLSGFESDEAARKFAGLLQAYLSTIGRYLDLERLDAVTVAYDYPAALANLDRGVEGAATLTATLEAYGMGVAMTPAVLRDGKVKCHMILYAAVLRGIEAEELNRDILYLIAHECGHVHDLKARDEAFPNLLMQTRYSNLRRNVLGSTAAACWDEYAACFFSAGFSHNETTNSLAEVFIGAATDARERANLSIRKYRTHGDIPTLIREVGVEYGNTLKFAAYLLGHLHGLGKNLSDQKAVSEFVQDHWCSKFVNRLDCALGSLMTRYGEWSDIAEFSILETIADELLQDGGIFISEVSDEEVFVRVPFTAETMP